MGSLRRDAEMAAVARSCSGRVAATERVAPAYPGARVPRAGVCNPILDPKHGILGIFRETSCILA